MNNEKIQENVMLIAPSVDTQTVALGNDVYVTTPWVMSDRVMCNFVGGVVSLHNSKSEASYVRGRILEVVNLGRVGSNKNRVAIAFKKISGKTQPGTIRKKYASTISETREQIRY